MFNSGELSVFSLCADGGGPTAEEVVVSEHYLLALCPRTDFVVGVRRQISGIRFLRKR